MKKNIVFLLLVTLLISCTSHGVKDNKDATPPDVTTTQQSDSLKPPHVTLLDTCRPPEVVPIPVKAGTRIIQSEKGKETIPLLPLQHKTAGFYAQMTNYTPREGVYSSVSCIKTDHTGNLWLGTMGGGVCRYDGKTFTTYTTAQGLAHSEVVGITEDRSGNMWFATTSGGVSCYDGKKFKTYTTSDGLANNYVLSIMTDKNGKIWVGTSDSGVSCYDPRRSADAGSKHFTTYRREQGLIDNTVYSILEDKTGNIWFGTKNGVSKYDPRQKTSGTQFSNYTVADGFAKDYAYCIAEDRAGNIWFGTSGSGICRYDPLKVGQTGLKVFTTYTHDQGLADNTVSSLLADRSGKIWIGSHGNGVSCYDPQKDTGPGSRPFTIFTVTEGLSNNDIWSIGEDNNGSIWFGTSGSGACRYDGKAFTTYSSDQGLAPNSVIGIVEDKRGDMWFSTDGSGVSRYEAYPPDGGPARFTTYTTAQGLGDNVVNGMLVDRNGSIWFATGGGGISCYTDQLHGKGSPGFTNYTTAQGLADNSLSSIAEDKDGDLWFGTYRFGVSRFDGRSFTNYTTAQGLSNNRVNTILADKAGNMWFGTNGGGVSCYDAAASKIQGRPVFRRFTSAQGLGSNFVWSIWQDKSGNLWFGTDGGGASRFDGKTFANFNAANALGSNGVYNIKEDANKNIWFGTNDGFMVFTGNRSITGNQKNNDPKLLSPDNLHHNTELAEDYEPIFEKYHFRNGYPVKDVNSNAMCIDSKGIVWAGSGDKLVRFDYSGIHKNPQPPHVFLDAVRIDGETICWNDLKGNSVKDSMATINEEVRAFGNVLTSARRDSMVHKFGRISFDSVSGFYPIPQDLVLPFKHNRVTFEFGANELARPYMVRYQYILEGYDKDWETVTDKTSATFGNIHEGTYTFKLKAQSPDGVWSEPISYTFTVSPPIYRTWWAYCLYILAVIYALVALLRWRTASLIKEKERLEAIVIERTAQVVEEKAKVVKLVEEQEQTIAERTAELANANKKLVELIQYNAHYMREPLARVMGAISISEFVDHDEFMNDIIPQMTRAANDLDNAIKEVIKVADETVGLKK